MANRLIEKFLNLFRQDEVYKMNQSNAEETLANIFAAAGKEPSTESLDTLLPEKEKTGSRHTPAILLVIFAVGIAALILILMLSGCGADSSEAAKAAAKEAARAELQAEAAANIKTGVGSRDSTPVCLVPEAPGIVVFGNELAEIDMSNAGEGYIVVRYTGDCPKVKLQITGPNEVTYTFNCKGDGVGEVFPLAAGSGTYEVAVYENIEGSQYAVAYNHEIEVEQLDPTRAFLYPNQYVDFDASSEAVAKGQELATPCSDDLEVVANVYNYLLSAVTYDEAEAESVQSGYIPDVDDVLRRGTGICLDYSALMATMLRSQRIPTRLEVGYAGIAYHAWISTYIKDVGWVNGIVEFDGQDWQLMDPTFAANATENDLKSFIGSGDNYELKYSY